MNKIEDPSQPSMELRVLLAVVLSLLVMLGYQYFLPTPQAPPPPLSTTAPFESPIETEDLQSTERPGLSGDIVPSTLPETQASPTRIRMINPSMELLWTNQRGRLLSARILRYRDDDGEPVEVIPQEIPDDATRPLELLIEGFEAALSQGVYDVEIDSGGMTDIPGVVGPGGTLTMRLRKGPLEIVRTFRMPDEGFTIEMSNQVRVDGRERPYFLTLGAGIGSTLDGGRGSDFSLPVAAYFLNGSVTRIEADDLEGERTERIHPRWLGLDSLYFSYLLLAPDEVQRVRMNGEKVLLADSEGVTSEVILARIDAEFDSGAEIAFFVGPKEIDTLRAVDSSLSNLIDYGTYLGFLVRPLALTLKWVHSYLGNYGWSIIALTLAINLLLFPVRYKQMVSMKKMAAIQPEMKAVQNKYKKMKRDDPRRVKMNEEVMALYKSKGVNPLGGCLPLVVQMPFLFAFYSMLSVSIELKGAPFIFWIQDLARPDPFYVTPLLVGATMFLQQKMTPMATADPMQRRMMMFMPLMFVFFFFSFSSGLAVYFLFSNVFGIAFQLVYQKLSPVGAADSGGGSKGPRKSSKKK